MQAATKVLGRPFRMTEGNSCFHGGKPVVSDTFASALWSGDYMLQVAQAGYIGVNLHGGGNGLYTPIAGDSPQGFSARPVYYGMLLAERFAGSTFVEASLSAQSAAQNRDGLRGEECDRTAGSWPSSTRPPIRSHQHDRPPGFAKRPSLVAQGACHRQPRGGHLRRKPR